LCNRKFCLRIQDDPLVTTSAPVDAETARLAALWRYGVLDTPREESFDRLVRMAARVLGTPIAAISLVDADRVWFKAELGLGATQVPRDLALCNRTIAADADIYEIADASSDPSLVDNPLLLPPVAVRFYAGATLVTPDGYRIGTLCVIDRVARSGLTPDQRATLIDLAGAVMTELERWHQHALRERAAARLALINDLLAGAGGATGFVAAIEAAITLLCRHSRALNGQLWTETGGPAVRALAFAADGAVSVERRANFFRLFSEASERGPRSLLPVSDRPCVLPEVTAEMAAKLPLMRAGYERGMRAFLLQPLTVGAERFGLVLTFGTPRHDLPELAELLSEVGQAIRPALQRKQAEDRLALLNDILADVGGAAGFVAAIEAAMRRLCVHTGAAYAHLWQQAEGASVRLVAFAADRDLPAWLIEEVFGEFPDLARRTTLEPLLAGDAPVLEPAVTEDTVAHLPLLHASWQHGMRSYLIHKLPVGAARYALILKFASERSDLPDVAALLNEVGQAIRPALLRKQAEERLALLNDVLAAIAGAPNFVAGIEGAITLLCRHTGAYFGHFWDQLDQGAAVRLLGLAGPEELPADVRASAFAAFPVPAERSLLAPIMATGGRLTLGDIPAELADKYPLLKAGLELGLRCLAAQAFAVADARYMLILGFNTARSDLDAVGDLLAEMSQAIRPAVLRKRAEDRLALINGVLASVAGAAGFRVAIEAVLERFCHHVGALWGLMWDKTDGADELRLVAVRAGEKARPDIPEAAAAAFPLPAGKSLLAPLLEVEGSRVVSAITDDMAEHHPLIAVGRTLGMRSFAAQSIVVGPRRYVLGFAFETERQDLDQVAALLADIGHAIRPALQRKQAEDQLALLQAAVDATTDAVVVTDASASAPTDRRVVHVNAAFTRMTGYAPEEAHGRNMRFLQGAGTAPESVVRLRDAVAACRAAREELLNYRRDGTPFWVELDIAPFADERGEVANWVGVLRDTTERRATQEALQRLAAALQERTAQLTEVAGLARIGSWIWRTGSDTMDWSDETFALFGVTRHTFTPTVDAFFNLLHPEDAPRARAAGAHAIRTGGDLHVEARVPLSGGRMRAIIWNGSPRRGPDGAVQELRGYCQDVTERRETEAALRHGEKLRALGKLTGGIAHEFNNLLTVVQANLEIALDDIEDLAEARPELEAARRAALAGTELTARLLSFARSEPVRSEPTDIGPWLAPLRDMATRTLGSRYRVTLRADPTLPCVAVDRSQLEGAVLNLILNARDAMPTGGTIAIETEPMEVPPGARGALADLLPGHYVVVAVRDSGAGMPPDVAERAFEPFFTTKPSGSGTGLGLSMVLSFARQSGGTALIETAPGRGTLVRIILPVAS
jgi:PAS domain S-box-containing protein